MEVKYKLQEGIPIRKVNKLEPEIISFKHDESVDASGLVEKVDD